MTDAEHATSGPSPPVEYRSASDEDAAASAQLWWEMQRVQLTYDRRLYALDGHADACKALWITRFRALLADPKCVIDVATSDGRLVGMIVAHRAARPPLYAVKQSLAIEVAVVAERFRRSGIFRGLLRRLEAVARAEGIDVIELSVSQRNPAVTAYERSGFVTDLFKMVKWLK